MNILYVFRWKLSPDTGVPFKVELQVETWKNLGHKVELLVICPPEFADEWRSRADVVVVSRGVERIWKDLNYLKKIRSSKTDFIYRRYGLFSLSEIKSFSEFPTAIEFNTDNDFYYTSRGIFHKLYHRFQKNNVHNHMLAGCAVTQEIATLEQTSGMSNVCVVTNPMAKLVEDSELIRSWTRPRLVFVGSDSFQWNGIEPLLKFAKDCPDYNFHFVGPLAISSQLANVYIHDSKKSEELRIFLSEMDIGLSTFSMDAIGLKEAAPLKTRLYFESRLPVVAAVADSGLPTKCSFYLHLDLQEYAYGENLELFRDFVLKNLGRRLLDSELAMLNRLQLEKSRLNFIETQLRDVRQRKVEI
jgi:hypothetical protein